MRERILKTLALLLSAALLLSCGACSGSRNEDPMSKIPESTGGRDVVRSAAADNVFSLNSNSRYSLDPFIATNHANQLICCLVYENMVELDNDFVVHPNVISRAEPNQDGTLWTFYIAEGHVFHDGSPVTPRDLRYSLERAIWADRYRGRFSSFKGASHTDEYLQVSLGVGDMQFNKLMNIPVVKYGTCGQTDTPPIGSGPYTFNEDKTELHAYEGYPGYATLPLDTIYIKEYQTAESTISAFEDGLIDVVINDPSSYTNLGYASTNETHTYATTNMHYVAFNQTSSVCMMAYFRVAMQYAFDRAYLVELLQGNGVASPIPMYPTVAEYPQELADDLGYNLELCRSVLENAGLRDYDEDGLLEVAAGSNQELNLRFVVSSDSSAKGGVAHRFAEDMASLGLTVTVVELTWSEYMKALEEGDFDMYYGEVKLRNNFDLTELLQTRVKADKDGKGGNEATNINYTNSSDPLVEQYINNYLIAGDTTRASAYETLCQYITGNTGAFVTLGFERQQIITHRGVARGIDANAGNPLYDFQNWIIDLGEAPETSPEPEPPQETPEDGEDGAGQDGEAGPDKTEEGGSKEND